MSLFDDFSVINEIFSKVDDHIEQNNLLLELNMSALPNLYDQFVHLIEILVKFVTHPENTTTVDMLLFENLRIIAFYPAERK